jgi:hypothetical protein
MLWQQRFRCGVVYGCNRAPGDHLGVPDKGSPPPSQPNGAIGTYRPGAGARDGGSAVKCAERDSMHAALDG